MTENINIAVSLHPQQYRVLTAIANGKTTDPKRPVQVHHLIEHLVAQVVDGKRPAPSMEPGPRARTPWIVDRDELRRLHAQGLNDRQIGERMGFNQATIRKHRHAIELDKNAKNGRPRAEVR